MKTCFYVKFIDFFDVGRADEAALPSVAELNNRWEKEVAFFQNR